MRKYLYKKGHIANSSSTVAEPCFPLPYNPTNTLMRQFTIIAIPDTCDKQECTYSGIGRGHGLID